MASHMKAAVQSIVDLLVAHKYAEVAFLTNGRRLDCLSIDNAIRNYGRHLIAPPDTAYDNLDIVPIEHSRFPQWSVRMHLWTEEEGRSDLSIDLTITLEHDNYTIELDDIHVL